MPLLILKTNTFLLEHMGGISLPSRDAGVCVQMGFGDTSLLVKLILVNLVQSNDAGT